MYPPPPTPLTLEEEQHFLVVIGVIYTFSDDNAWTLSGEAALWGSQVNWLVLGMLLGGKHFNRSHLLPNSAELDHWLDLSFWQSEGLLTDSYVDCQIFKRGPFSRARTKKKHTHTTGLFWFKIHGLLILQPWFRGFCCYCRRSQVGPHLQLLAGSPKHHRAGFGGLQRDRVNSELLESRYQKVFYSSWWRFWR